MSSAIRSIRRTWSRWSRSLAARRPRKRPFERAAEFYTGLGKQAVRLRKEVPGHVANRLQAALAREVYYLVAEGVVSAADVDTALCWGPGLRWGIMGNMMLNHLGGGQGGIEHFFQQFTGPMTAWWKVLGQPVLTLEVQKKLIDSVHAEVGSRSIAELEAQRDEVLLGLLELRAQGREGACDAQGGCPRRLRGGGLSDLCHSHRIMHKVTPMTAALEETRPREKLPRPEAAPAKRKRVVIIGGGFAGIAAARALKRCDAEVVLIDRRNHHIFQPLLYQVATAVLAPAEIAAPIRQIEEKQTNLTVMLAEVTAVDLSSRSVSVSYSASGSP